MNILLLSRRFEIYSTHRLVQEGAALGLTVSLWDPGKPFTEYVAAGLPLPDLIVPRLGSYEFSAALKVVEDFENAGVVCVNSSRAYKKSRNKWTLYQELIRQSLPTPKTSLYSEDLELEYPVVLKVLESSQGDGVVLAQSHEDVLKFKAAFPGEKFLVQEWICEAQGSDYRALVVGDKVVAAMKRTAAPGDFRSNLHKGGQAEECILSLEEEQLAVSLARHLDLHIAGVDFLRSKRGSLLLEANPCPGLEGIEACTKLNLARIILETISVRP